MSNLGAYQDFVTDAKQLGGVQSYLRLLEANAVANAAPRLYARAVILTLVALGGMAALGLEAKRRLQARDTLRCEADAAREQLVTATQQAAEGNGGPQTFGPWATNAGARACAWCGRLGHDKQSCDIPNDASACTACGYHGHGSENCLRGQA
jgi:hypothetical protein